MEVRMRPKLVGLSLLISAFLCIGTLIPQVDAKLIQNGNFEVQTQSNALTKEAPLVFAGSPAVCQANYDQCMRGCGGAASCSNQCMTNYNGCLK
jgi:hypothetical protein